MNNAFLPRPAVVMSAKRAAEDELLRAKEEAMKVFSSAPGHSTTVLLMGKLASEGYRRGCEAAANRIAEIEQGNAVWYLDALRDALDSLQDEAIQIVRGKRFSPSSSFNGLVEKTASDCKQACAKVLQSVLDDLSLGIAGGVNVDRSKSRIIAIHNAGAAQFQIDSPGATQTVGRDLMASIGPDAAEIVALLAELRVGLNAIGLPQQERDEVDDAITNIERELQAETPSPSRLKRLIRGLVGFSEKVAASATGGILARLFELAQSLA